MSGTYIPNPLDPTRPQGNDPAASAAAEFRALKAYVLSLVGLPGGNLFRKNILINGDFRVDQRNASTNPTINNGGKYAVDKFFAVANAAATITIGQSYAIGIGNQLSAQYAMTAPGNSLAGEFAGIKTGVEGWDAVQLNFGTAQAKNISLSFIMSSNLPGTHCVALRNAAANRTYIAPFNIPLSGVATPITINNIPGDITGAWNRINGLGLEICFDFGSGANYESVIVNAWQPGIYTRTPGAERPTGFAGTMLISNVQLEQNLGATAFEQTPFGYQLTLCERYYWKSFWPNIVPAQNAGIGGALTAQALAAATKITFSQKFTKQMRLAPSIITFNPSAVNAQARDVTGAVDCNTTTVIDADPGGVMITAISNAASVLANICQLQVTANADFY